MAAPRIPKSLIPFTISLGISAGTYLGSKVSKNDEKGREIIKRLLSEIDEIIHRERGDSGDSDVDSVDEGGSDEMILPPEIPHLEEEEEDELSTESRDEVIKEFSPKPDESSSETSPVENSSNENPDFKIIQRGTTDRSWTSITHGGRRGGVPEYIKQHLQRYGRGLRVFGSPINQWHRGSPRFTS